MKKIITLFCVSVIALSACGESTQIDNTASQTVNASATQADVPTKKYPDVKAMFDDKNNYPSDNGSFKLIKQTPPEFLIAPEISTQENQDGILSIYKYAALEGLLLTFAQTDAEQIIVHIQPRIINNEKPISDAARAAVKLKITMKAKREDVANALQKIQIYDFDQLIEHKPSDIAIAGSTASSTYTNLRKSDSASWTLINQFRTDKNKM